MIIFNYEGIKANIKMKLKKDYNVYFSSVENNCWNLSVFKKNTRHKKEFSLWIGFGEFFDKLEGDYFLDLYGTQNLYKFEGLIRDLKTKLEQHFKGVN